MYIILFLFWLRTPLNEIKQGPYTCLSEIKPNKITTKLYKPGQSDIAKKEVIKAADDSQRKKNRVDVTSVLKSKLQNLH